MHSGSELVTDLFKKTGITFKNLIDIQFVLPILRSENIR